MIMVKGFLEILKMADSNEPKSFNDFTKITIDKKLLSSATVSKRLDELIEVKAIKEVVDKSKRGRRVIAYRATEKGKMIIKMGKELKDAVAVQKAK
jgi:DNA-binding HxlR family transcriptional regulator